jgi:hypothetical protein
MHTGIDHTYINHISSIYRPYIDLDQDPLSVSLGQDITILMRLVVIFDMLMMLMWMPSSSSSVPFGPSHASLGVS